MGTYLRYISTDSQPITLALLETALQEFDPAYHIAGGQIDDSADLFYGEMICGQIEINVPGDDIFEDDIDEMTALVDGEESPVETRILAVLKKAQAIIAVEAEWEGIESEATLEKLDPLWDWLFDHFKGLLQADNEGFYDSERLILPLDLKL